MRTFADINEKIKNGDVVVITAEEAVRLVKEVGVKEAAKEVDVVTTGTFGAMCSSGVFLNFGHTEPPMWMNKVWLNDVPVCKQLAAVDAYLGASARRDEESVEYGGGDVIEALIKGEEVHLRAEAYGTDCYPKKEFETWITLDSINQAVMFNPRNSYQNYNAATNSSKRILHTYMGKLLPNYGNVTYSSAGQMSPLLKDPFLKTIGVGTRIFLGGAQGHVSWEGTQTTLDVLRAENGTPLEGAATLATTGNLKEMSSEFIRALHIKGYGVSLAVGIGVPIPILDEEVMKYASLGNDELYARIIDYSVPSRDRPALKVVSYAELRSGRVELNGRNVRTGSMSSYFMARKVAKKLKRWIEDGEFLLQEPIRKIPIEGVKRDLDEVKPGERKGNNKQ